MSFAEHRPLQAAGQMLLAAAFLASGARNAFWKFVPNARFALVAGLGLLFTGALLLLFDYQRAVGAWLLIVFTVVASAIFHRWWRIEDPLLRHLHIGNLLVNCGVVGGLLLVAAI